MNPIKKKSYKERNGTTRVGDFLRSIGKSKTLNKILDVGTNLATGNVSGALKNILKGSDELTPEQRNFALELLKSDVEENKEVSNRWKFDMNSDSWLSKNVRPLMLIYLTLMMTLIAILDSSLVKFTVNEAWISLLQTLLITAYVAYFGGRSYEKNKKL